MSQFDNVSVVKQANVYFDGKCVSHTIQFADASKKTAGVILPASLTFNTGAPAVMGGGGGVCGHRLGFIRQDGGGDRRRLGPFAGPVRR